MPTKREMRVRFLKRFGATFAAAELLYWMAQADRASFFITAGFLLAVWRRVINWADPPIVGYEIHDVDGVERYFCEVCGKEEGDCARCYEIEVRLRSDG